MWRCTRPRGRASGAWRPTYNGDVGGHAAPPRGGGDSDTRTRRLLGGEGRQDFA
jgi:hypothetical protein